MELSVPAAIFACAWVLLYVPKARHILVCLAGAGFAGRALERCPQDDSFSR